MTIPDLIRRFKEGESLLDLANETGLYYVTVEKIIRAYMLGYDAGKEKP